MRVRVLLLNYVHRFLKCSRAASPTIVSGMRFRESPHCAAQVALFTKVVVNMFQAEFEGPRLVSRLFKREISAHFDFIEAHHPITPFPPETELDQIMRLCVDHAI
jgi:hypothetical protein